MLNRPFITLATIAGASLFSLASSFADTGAIAGNVLDFKGKALAGAEVRIERVANKSVAATTRTDAKGRFAVGNLPPVAYNVHVFVAGKEATSTNNVKAGSPEPTMVRFDLRPTQAASKATSTSSPGSGTKKLSRRCVIIGAHARVNGETEGTSISTRPRCSGSSALVTTAR